jgi:hypothetical protein
MPSIEQLFGGTLREQPTIVLSDGRTDPWAGHTLVESGTTTVTVSTNLVSSGKTLWLMGVSHVGSIAAATNSGAGIVVSSVVDGVSFALARPTGVAVPWNEYVDWAMFRVL